MVGSNQPPPQHLMLDFCTILFCRLVNLNFLPIKQRHHSGLKTSKLLTKYIQINPMHKLCVLCNLHQETPKSGEVWQAPRTRHMLYTSTSDAHNGKFVALFTIINTLADIHK